MLTSSSYLHNIATFQALHNYQIPIIPTLECITSYLGNPLRLHHHSTIQAKTSIPSYYSDLIRRFVGWHSEGEGTLEDATAAEGLCLEFLGVDSRNKLEVNHVSINHIGYLFFGEQWRRLPVPKGVVDEEKCELTFPYFAALGGHTACFADGHIFSSPESRFVFEAVCGLRPLHMAVLGGHLETVQALHEYETRAGGIKFAKRVYHGNGQDTTIWMCSFASGSDVIAKYVQTNMPLSHESTSYPTTNYELTSMLTALIQRGLTEGLSCFLRNVEKPEDKVSQLTLLTVADTAESLRLVFRLYRQYNKTPNLQMFLQRCTKVDLLHETLLQEPTCCNVNLDSSGLRLVHRFASCGDVKGLEMLWALPNSKAEIFSVVTDPKLGGMSNALHFAIKGLTSCSEKDKDPLDAIRFLVENVPELLDQKDTRGYTPCDVAIECGTPECVQYLHNIKPGLFSLTSRWAPVVREACARSNGRVLRNLLSLDPTDPLGIIPTLLTQLRHELGSKTGLTMKTFQLMESLCMSRLYEPKDDAGNTCAHLVCSHGQVDFALELVYKAPSLLGARNNKGMTPLHMAATTQAGLTCLNTLLQHHSVKVKEFVGCQDHSGNTFLHIAALSATSGAGSILPMLLQFDELRHVHRVLNEDGETWIDVAQKNPKLNNVWKSLLLEKSSVIK